MTIETTTATTTQTTAVGELFNVTVYEQTVTGFCDICGTQQTGSAASLKRCGWYLGSREHFCPNCND